MVVRYLPKFAQIVLKGEANQTFFGENFQVSPGAEQREVKFCGEVLQRELDFCFRAIKKVKSNESSWNYLNG